MLESLTDQPANASMLAREALGESSGATSYHLRALAAAGLIIEDFERRKGASAGGNATRSASGRSTPRPRIPNKRRRRWLEARCSDTDEDALRRFIHQKRREGVRQRRVAGMAFIGGWTVYATQEEVNELSEPSSAGSARGSARERTRPGHTARLRHLLRAPQTPTAE